ncbi:MAG: hypothetical protein ACR2MB_13455 [Acidimicrobiales bacterium]
MSGEVLAKYPLTEDDYSYSYGYGYYPYDGGPPLRKYDFSR